MPGGDKNGATNVGVPVGRVKIGLFISTAVASTIESRVGKIFIVNDTYRAIVYIGRAS